MCVYEILPGVKSNVADLKMIPNVSLKYCRKYCDDEPECGAFEYNKGRCHLKKYEKFYDLEPEKHSTVYLKKGNSNYFVLWMILVIIACVAFYVMC